MLAAFEARVLAMPISQAGGVPIRSMRRWNVLGRWLQSVVDFEDVLVEEIGMEEIGMEVGGGMEEGVEGEAGVVAVAEVAVDGDGRRW